MSTRIGVGKGTVLVAALVFAGLGQQRLMAATVQVGGCLIGPANFTTIQAALTASPAGTTIDICPGTYKEQVTINKNGIKLVGVSSGFAANPVVTSPLGGVGANTTSLATSNPIAAQILVGGTATPALTGVNISSITVDGSNNQLSTCGAATLVGIFYQNASGMISQVATRNQTLAPGDGGCQNGLGIFVQSGHSLTSTVTVQDSSVHSYQKNGITGNEAGTTITVTENYIVGQGPTTGAAENGIQIGFGATGKITNNSVVDDIWAPDTINDPGDAAAGILIYAAAPTGGGATINGNVVADTQFGIAIITDLSSGPPANAWPIMQNMVSGTHIFDGIDVCSNGNNVTSNTVFSSDESAIHLDSSCGSTGSRNTVKNNTINEACAGILVGTGTSGNTTSPNTINNAEHTILNADSCTTPVFGASRPGIAAAGQLRRPLPMRP